MDKPKRTVRLLLLMSCSTSTWTRHEAGERGAEPHVHREHTDSFYVLEGELTFRIGPDLERVSAPAGTFVAVPPNVIHGFDNDARRLLASSTSMLLAAALPSTCAA